MRILGIVAVCVGLGGCLADQMPFGRGALATPDLPNRLAAKLPLNDFDPAILGPIADIKESELAYEPA